MDCGEEVKVVKCKKCGVEYELYQPKTRSSGGIGTQKDIYADTELANKNDVEFKSFKARAKLRGHEVAKYYESQFLLKCSRCGYTNCVTIDDDGRVQVS